jgi:hypothetical protein
LKRPPFPPLLLGRARIFIERRLEKGVWKDIWGPKTLVGVRDEEVHAWEKNRIEALWKTLPWRNGRIEWSYDPDHRVLVVRWESPIRRGWLRLREVMVAS